MTLVPGIDSATREAQAKATDPRGSAWVSANAGSGKTFVLSRRVIRLLLAGVDPSAILCLTFTKAAAAEMAQRVFAELGRWTALSDAELSAEIAAVEGVRPDAEKMAAARRLFARALDTPGGLKIQTIHAFCERLLHQFPFEANVAGHFEVLDERNAAALKDAARSAVLARAAADPAGRLGRALQTVLACVSDRTHEDSLKAFIDARDAVDGWLRRAGETIEDAVADLRAALAVPPGVTAAGLRRSGVDSPNFDAAEFRRLLGELHGGSAADVSAAGRLAPLVESDDPEARYAALIDFFFTGDDLRKSPVTKKIQAGWPGLQEKLDAEGARLVALVDAVRTADLFESTAAMLRLGEGAIAEYDRLKRQRGVLDFEDLVVRTAYLLARSDAARWVHYKLDRGIDHILVDEAQDTSPRQWQVVSALAEEFFAGEGAGSAVRTLFAVGDEKQSIFSFQGAVPAWFARMARELGAQARAAGYPWEGPELHLSFRSVPKILAAVDAVFAAPAVHAGLTAEPRPTIHTARRRNEPGRVVVWPRYEAPSKSEASDWVLPLDHLGEDSPEVKLARRIAATIRGWLDRGEVLDAPGADGAPRPIRPGGILILVRSRGALADAINRELKTQKVPIAGSDRIAITEHIAVMDLMAAGRVALLPEDDLSLAALLKSPLVGLDEEALFDLAHDRSGSLWAALGEKAEGREEFARALRLIEGWRDVADTIDPHAFFARILGPDSGRKAFLRRLGPEADDVLDEFIAQALAYEQANAPSLEGFLHWLTAAEMEVRRDTDSLRDEVRVMTVHGAKGLEADVVFLVDNGTPPNIPGHDRKVLPLADDADPAAPGPVVWMRSVKAMPAAVRARVENERERDREEYRRLLYVGMTRARDRLYVVGIVRQERTEDTRWHPLVVAALEGEGEFVTREAPDGEVEREWRPEVSGKRVSADAGTLSPPPSTPLPTWVTTAVTDTVIPARRVTPSTVAAPAPQHQAAVRAALHRGRLVHRLLESLPEIPAESRRFVAEKYLAAFAEDALDPAAQAALLARVLAILDDPEFAAVFAAGSRAEVEIAGNINGLAISGRIDRLAVAADRVLIVDYKTNRPAPENLAAVPPAYITQLALYRLVLSRLYPDRRVAAALLWTEVPRLMEVPEAVLLAAESALFA